MNTAAEQPVEVSDVSAWVALYHRASTVPSTPLVSPEAYAAVIGSVTDRRDRAILLVLRDSALRATELVQLDRDMITCETRKLADGSIRSVGIGLVPSAKLRGERQFFLSSEAVSAIADYLTNDRKDNTDRVLFANRYGGRLGAASIRKLLSESCDRAGIERFGLHEFRRSLAARLCEGGCDLRAIKSALGCAKTETIAELLPPFDMSIS